MTTEEARGLVRRILEKEARGLPRGNAVNSVLAGKSIDERAQVMRQLAVEENHGVSP
jgi:hypothetical protein